MESTTTTFDFDNIINFRDVGETVNAFLAKRFVKEGLFFRSARPDDASLHDRKLLRDDLGIRTVMDLRTKTEHDRQSKMRQAALAGTGPALLRSNDALAEPLKIPGLQYREVRITGRAFERHLLRQLTWLSWFKVIFLFILGFRIEAVAILGREVMNPRGLSGLAVDTLDNSGAEVAEALRCLVEPGGLPVLVHCTQGKDRTGIIVILVLMILGVPLAAIEHDYRLSDEGLASEKEQRIAEIHEIGLTEEWAVVAPNMIPAVAGHLDSRYGGLESYLDRIGFSDDERARLRELLAY
ncbi:hypothetical protein MGG_07475 [Pyricularia oryzae 70-15]|uniref:Tyrosine specific protein phosphatases domain-containing protein n=4 Tax=Pyricularia oryzae TaxID=318829 RepID=G4N194_PYRO7|nr:uncharacterized protein MGG_07475 [Pyricularia oryzae 70-15]EHA51574.1 hypothetical protein MGG_07475 [Pyricularia oryzae 70-15]KAI7926795.1 hypothetical protein M9X92_002534 [Pyricularia oryzae]KAI7928331.1 hypothetical protein M0657_002730 [Pyricularia oryzae]